MNTKLIRLIVILLLLSVPGSALAQDGDGDDDQPLQPVFGAVNIIVPNLYMQAPDADEAEMVSRPTIFDAGETLTTDETGVGLITFFYDGTETVLGQNSSLTLNAFSDDSQSDFVIDMTLNEGHVVSGLGAVANMASGDWTLETPAFTINLLRGQFEVTVGADGATRLIVLQGRVEVSVDGGEAFAVDEGQYLTGGMAEPASFSEDGITVDLDGICTATANTNLNVRLAPTEDSRKLGRAEEGQVMWVRSGTEGLLWHQVYFETAPDDEEGQNFGWVYGPATTLAEDGCDAVLRAPLDAQIFGGLGIDESPGEAGKSDPLADE
jgi:hypothetical protein